MTLNPDWRKWADDHPVRARRLIVGLDEHLATIADAPENVAAVWRTKRDLLAQGVADHDARLAAALHFARATDIRAAS